MSDLMTEQFKNQAWSSSVTSMSFQNGLLPLDGSLAGQNGRRLDKHFTSMAQIFGHGGWQYRGTHDSSTCLDAVLVGYENGDFLSTNTHHIWVRTANTTDMTDANKLLSYNISADGGRDTKLENLGVFDANKRPWYTSGRECGRINGTKYGNTCISDPYVDAVTGRTILSVTQPFFECTGADMCTLLGRP